jgi:outer membrane protein assembly factor BamE
MKKLIGALLVATVFTSITACSSLRFPGVYRIKIEQGNYIEEEMVEQLVKGMTRRQVRYVMGSPLVKDSFNRERWDYYYTVSRNNEVLKEYQFSVFFEGDLLTRWEGDYEPSKESVKETQEEALKAAEKKDAAKF